MKRWSWVLVALATAASAACASTSGRAIELPVLAVGRAAEGEALGEFTTSTGWRVTLAEAEVGLVALRALPADGSVARLERARRRLGALLVPVAHAHGGHGAHELGVRMELLGRFVLDALAAEPRTLGVAVGTAGPVGAMELTLGTLPETSFVARVAGRAERDDVVVEFAGELALASGTRGISGLPLEAELDEGELHLELRAERWFDQAHFDRLEGAGEGRAVIAPDGQVALAWQLGLRDARAFSGVFVPLEEE